MAAPVSGPDAMETVPDTELEEQAEPEAPDGIDDPVRFYLSEIGQPDLLSSADEKRLARQIEEANHIQAITQFLHIDKSPLCELVVNETFRNALDGELDQALANHLTCSLRCDLEQ